MKKRIRKGSIGCFWVLQGPTMTAKKKPPNQHFPTYSTHIILPLSHLTPLSSFLSFLSLSFSFFLPFFSKSHAWFFLSFSFSFFLLHSSTIIFFFLFHLFIPIWSHAADPPTPTPSTLISPSPSSFPPLFAFLCFLVNKSSVFFFFSFFS